MDIIDRLRNEAIRSADNPIWIDAIIEITRLRAELAQHLPQPVLPDFGPVYVPQWWEQPRTTPFPNPPVITC